MQEDTLYKLYKNCNLCPRACHVDRLSGQLGFCSCNAPKANVNLTMLHFGEEPVISGVRGSGAVFFEGCQLRCVFCQNYQISRAPTFTGKAMTAQELSSEYLRLEASGAHNINLVTPLHYAPTIKESILIARERGLKLPFAMNVGGYESVETLKLFEGLVDIYMPDLKFYSSELSSKLAKAPNYFEIASKAIDCMYSQVGPIKLGSDGMLEKGLIVRHLMLPGQVFDSKHICKHLVENYGNNIYISLMNQYTPMPLPLDSSISDKLKDELSSTLNPRAYSILTDYLCDMGQVNAFVQSDSSSGNEMIPDFK